VDGKLCSLGYWVSSPFRNGDEEVAALKIRRWSSTSLDFEAKAKLSGTPLPAANFDEFLDQLRGLEIGSVDRLGVAGHGGCRGIALSGSFREDWNGLHVYLANDSTISIEMLKCKKDDIDQVKDRFSKKASITLFGCSTGQTPEYLKAWEDAFGVECKGFAGAVRTKFRYSCDEVNKGGVILLMNYKVTKRDLVAYAPILRDVYHTPDNLFRDNLWLLTPDRSSRHGN